MTLTCPIERLPLVPLAAPNHPLCPAMIMIMIMMVVMVVKIVMVMMVVMVMVVMLGMVVTWSSPTVLHKNSLRHNI